jgi:hypothetical protein
LHPWRADDILRMELNDALTRIFVLETSNHGDLVAVEATDQIFWAKEPDADSLLPIVEDLVSRGKPLKLDGNVIESNLDILLAGKKKKDHRQ